MTGPLFWSAPTAMFPPPPPMTTFAHWPPLAVLDEIAAACGTGQAFAPSTTERRVAILSRIGDRPSGGAWVALTGGVARILGLSVLPDLRRRGSGTHLVQAAADWARREGASEIVVRGDAHGAEFCTTLGLIPRASLP